jgi:hypothetical protein
MRFQEVRKILDIEDIENYLAFVFTLSMYDGGDNTVFYDCKVDDNYSIFINLITTEKLIVGDIDLADILTRYDIDYFEWILYDDYYDEAVSAFAFRPHIDEEEKNY